MNSPKTKFHADVLRHAYGDIVKNVDGYYIYWPIDMAVRGAWTSAHLHMLADILDAANRLWDQEVRRDLGSDS